MCIEYLMKRYLKRLISVSLMAYYYEKYTVNKRIIINKNNRTATVTKIEVSGKR